MTINQRKAGSILSYVYIFLSNTISIFYTPIFLGMLGQTEYGLIGTANSITSYLSLLSMGVGGAYIRFNARARATGDKEDEYRVNGMFQTIYLFIALATLLVGIVLIFCSSYIFSSKYSSTELVEIKLIMICTVAQFIVTFVFNTTAMALQAYERYYFLKMCQIVGCVLQPFINIFALYLGGRAVTISVISLLISFFTYIIYYIFAKKKIGLKFIFNGFDRSILKGIFVFSSYLFINSITNQLTFTSDSVILGVTSGSIAVAIYTVGSNFKSYFMSFSTSVSNVFAPQINKIVAHNGDKKALDDIFIKIGRVQFYIVSLILTGYIFFGRQFIILWVTDKYEESYLIGLFLMISVFVPCFQNVGIEIQKAKNLHKARSIVYFLIAIVNVLITIPLSIKYQGAGAAFATLLCMFCGTVIFMNIYNHKVVGINIISFWKSIAKIIPSLIAPVILGILIIKFVSIDSYSKLLFYVIIYCVVFFLSVWFISMNKYEKDLIIAPIKRLLKKFNKA